jgi:hypothetical protein
MHATTLLFPRTLICEGPVVVRWLSGFFLLGAVTLASAQPATVQRTVKGLPDKDIRIGVYLNVRPDCTSGELPALKLVAAPAHGKVTFKKAKINSTNYKECLALEVPGWVGFYRSQPNFSGDDTFSIQITYPNNGRTELQQIKMTIGSADGQKI